MTESPNRSVSDRIDPEDEPAAITARLIAGVPLVRSIDGLRERAEAGDAQAQRALGFALHTGSGVCKDIAQALHWYERAATSDPAAKVLLGMFYAVGAEAVEDKERAASLFRSAAEQGNAEGEYYLAQCYFNGTGVARDSAQGISWLRRAAEQGRRWAQARLGWQLQMGDGVPKDDAAAVEWYRRAAEQGSVVAFRLLGECYAQGAGVPADLAEAVRLFRQAADQGSGEAQCLLARCYEWGTGVPKDFGEAAKWYSRAVEGGDLEAHAGLAALLIEGQGIPRDVSRGLSLLRHGWENGDTQCGKYLAYCLCEGAGLKPNYQEAIPILQRLPRGSDGYIECLLGRCYLGGHGVARDFAVARELLKQSSDLGFGPARHLLRILPFQRNPILRHRGIALTLLGWSFLVAYAVLETSAFDIIGVCKFLGVILVAGALSLGLVAAVPSLKARTFADMKEAPNLAPTPLQRYFLGVPAEDGLFLVPLLFLGVSPLSAAVAALLFGASHYPNYPWITCIPKAVGYFVVAMWILLPYGIWTVIVGHLVLDLLVEAVTRLTWRSLMRAE